MNPIATIRTSFTPVAEKRCAGCSFSFSVNATLTIDHLQRNPVTGFCRFTDTEPQNGSGSDGRFSHGQDAAGQAEGRK